MDRLRRARRRANIVDTLAKVGIVAIYDESAGGFLLMKQGAGNDGEDLWERALSAPVLVLTDEEYESPACAEIAWHKAGNLLRDQRTA